MYASTDMRTLMKADTLTQRRQINKTNYIPSFPKLNTLYIQNPDLGKSISFLTSFQLIRFSSFFGM